jgi:hypothetical protein
MLLHCSVSLDIPVIAKGDIVVRCWTPYGFQTGQSMFWAVEGIAPSPVTSEKDFKYGEYQAHIMVHNGSLPSAIIFSSKGSAAF